VTAVRASGKGAAPARSAAPGPRAWRDLRPTASRRSTFSVDHSDLKQRIYAGRFLLTTVYELDIDGGQNNEVHPARFSSSIR